jgi:hypothetical protein
MAGDGRPGPITDLDSEPFWAALRRGAVVVQACDECGRHRFGRVGACPYCGAPGGSDVEIAGTGTIYSFVRVHRALTDAMAGDVPYAVATVDLDGGARMLGRVEPPGAARIGAHVSPVFVDHGDWTELRFRAGDATDDRA